MAVIKQHLIHILRIYSNGTQRHFIFGKKKRMNIFKPEADRHIHSQHTAHTHTDAHASTNIMKRLEDNAEYNRGTLETCAGDNNDDEENDMMTKTTNIYLYYNLYNMYFTLRNAGF